jgi:dipeptidyl aminopeptidase/acylaminoacyl peptidase
MPMASFRVLPILLLVAVGSAQAQRRTMRPDDLFRLERVGPIVWTPDRSHAAVEMRRTDRWLDSGIPTAMMAVVDTATGTLRTISPASAAYVGFFGAAWSPDSRRLLFLSVDTNAAVRPWLWTLGGGPPVLLPGLDLQDAPSDPAVALWSDAEHALFLVRDTALPREGQLYSRIQRGRNVADQWARARAGGAAVTVYDSRPQPTENATTDGAAGESRIVSINLRTRTVATVASGRLHRARLSADGHTLSYWREQPPVTSARVATFFGPDAIGDAAYDRVNWGSRMEHVDARTGAPVPPPVAARQSAPAPATSLRVASSATAGSRLLLQREGRGEAQVWEGNTWVRDIEPGRAEAIAYTSTNGTALTGWVLYPPGHVAGRRIPMVTIVYPGRIFDVRVPTTFDILNSDFEHPQLFAALGYGVLLPSMPEAEQPLQSDALGALTAGVLPLIDTLVARGIADASRIAVLGQSAGGWATLGLITTTQRFRTAMASASYGNLVSLYGTFYGQYRYGDSGHAQRAQLLRTLQFERGYYGAGAPYWEQPDRYRRNSPIWRVADVTTPLLLVHGDADYIPVQQAEEFFTALYRQDKRVRLVRYAGEGHTISARAHVLDLWRQFDDWLRETLRN